MTDQRFVRLRLGLTLMATLAELANLAWEHLHGGVVSHHLLDRADLPSVSNGWSGLLIPVLVWFLIGRIQRRIARCSDREKAVSKLPLPVVVGFAVALLLGILIAVCFTHGYPTATSYLFLGMIVLALPLPGYRAECVLGFVLGMTLTFGAVLPTMVACVIALGSAAIHLGVRPLLVRLGNRFKRLQPPIA